MKVKEQPSWDISLVESYRNKAKIYREMYAPDTFKETIKNTAEKTVCRKNFISIIKNLIKKLF